MQIVPQDICRRFEGEYDQYVTEINGYRINKCIRTWFSLAGKEKVIAHVLCAKNPDPGKATCSGDSGGPLTVKHDGHHVLVGITSSGFGCGLVSSPLQPSRRWEGPIIDIFTKIPANQTSPKMVLSKFGKILTIFFL